MIDLFGWIDSFISSDGWNCFLYSIALLSVGVFIGVCVNIWWGGK